MHDPQVDGILRQLRSRDPRDGWAAFLDAYSPLLLDTVRLFERDEDAIGDCYLFACEQLRRNRFRRLLRFRTEGPASFRTWLRAVCRNFCVDWHRQEFGRHRVFESVSRLPALDQEIFTRVYLEGLSALRVRGYRLYFLSREETRPHVHVQHASGEAKIWLDPKVALANNYGLSEARAAVAVRIARGHEDDIRAAWRAHFEG